MEYRVLRATSTNSDEALDRLEGAVNACLGVGWEISGGVSLVATGDSLQPCALFIASQAVIRH
jgi:hypothetical protein